MTGIFPYGAEVAQGRGLHPGNAGCKMAHVPCRGALTSCTEEAEGTVATRWVWRTCSKQLLRFLEIHGMQSLNISVTKRSVFPDKPKCLILLLPSPMTTALPFLSWSS
jgi:hypothetical protein